MAEHRLEIRWATAMRTDKDHEKEYTQHRGGSPVLKDCARSNPTVVKVGKKYRQADPHKQPRQKHRLPRHAIKLHRIELRNNVSGQLPQRHRFPWTHYGILRKHHPTRR